jgi:hypothetical protein
MAPEVPMRIAWPESAVVRGQADSSMWSTPAELVPGPEGEAGRGAVRTEQIVVGGLVLAGGSTEVKDAAVVAEMKSTGAGPHSARSESRDRQRCTSTASFAVHSGSVRMTVDLTRGMR